MKNSFGWGAVARLGLVQACIGAVVVLTTSTLNRIMVVELALPALLPGLLVAFHYFVQMARPRMGHGSDVGGRRTPWIIGGMAVLGVGGVLAAAATALMGTDRAAGIALSVLGFALVGLGVSAAGTALLTLLAKRVTPERRSASATLVWITMIAGFAITALSAGKLLDPYSPQRLVAVSAAVSLIALLVTLVALHGLEGEADLPEPQRQRMAFRAALAQVWEEPAARRFTVFVFVSMLAFSAQDLILEPFAGTVFGFTPGASTQLSGVQHGGVMLGMLLAATARGPGALRAWTVGGCLASALALLALTGAGITGSGPLKAMVFTLGAANGAFSIGAIGSMMRLAGEGRGSMEGVRMGLWGAAQAVAFAFGGLVGTGASDLARWLIASAGSAYAAVFAFEAVLFMVSAVLAWRIGAPPAARDRWHGATPTGAVS